MQINILNHSVHNWFYLLNKYYMFPIQFVLIKFNLIFGKLNFWNCMQGIKYTDRSVPIVLYCSFWWEALATFLINDQSVQSLGNTNNYDYSMLCPSLYHTHANLLIYSVQCLERQCVDVRLSTSKMAEQLLNSMHYNCPVLWISTCRDSSKHRYKRQWVFSWQITVLYC